MRKTFPIRLLVTLLLPVFARAQAYSPKDMKEIKALAAASAEAKVQLKNSQGAEIKLKPEEKMAFLFMDAISAMETDCHYALHRPCSLEELVKGSPATSPQIGQLKFNPYLDENYEYTVTISSDGWEGRAKPAHSGLGGLFYDGKDRSMARSYFNSAGPATSGNTPLGDAIVLGTFRTK
ncbi:MAG TPA: hypothetical protein VN176_09545 [Verrucomicrobiae bacterium]|jgi:hypothetical protein|nr:hypothetical protein [Verrucomicrobiae bacterium]